MISAIASSTTDRVFENGALKTGMPSRAARARSIWLVPMENARGDEGRGGVEDALGQLGLRPDADELHAVERLDQLVLVHRAGVVDDLDAGVAEDLRGLGVKVLE